MIIIIIIKLLRLITCAPKKVNCILSEMIDLSYKKNY